MAPSGSRFRRALAYAAGLFLLAVVGGGCYAHQRVAASLAVTGGSRTLPGLEAPVTVARDGLGIPTIAAASRLDAARALGYVHAQERFFQMDLQRRQPAGELAALVGARALPVDRAARLHRFRDVARQAVVMATPSYRAVLTAYTEGVNAGLVALSTPPFEYTLLDATPEPWRDEDSVLTVLAMFETLQGRQEGFERTMGEIHDVLPAPLAAFLTAPGSAWDAPVEGDPFPRPPIPAGSAGSAGSSGSAGSTGSAGSSGSSGSPGSFSSSGSARIVDLPWLAALSADEAAGVGSNNWVVDGAHSATGAALVANDMHLSLGVPNIWYRATMIFPDPVAPGGTRRLSGLTLPGLPNLVVGSNGEIAWGFTNSGGDWSDLVVVEIDPRDPSRYQTPDGPVPFEDIDEAIAIKDAPPEALHIRTTIWGPIVGSDLHGRPLAQHWVAHDPAALATDTLAPERARSTLDAITRVFPGLGIPAQNVVVGDRAGDIGWTIAGPIPRRVGHDGMRPVSWADGTNRWDGYLDAAEFPRILNPPGGRIWTANAPVITGPGLAVLGDGGYADGIRARLIRDRLRVVEQATPGDMLRIQLEDGALFLERWRQLALGTLDSGTVQADPARAEFRRLLETTWTGRASTGSAAYRLVREFRSAVAARVFGAITAPVVAADPGFEFARALRSEGPLWQLITARPANLLPPGNEDWQALFADAIDETISKLTADGEDLADRTWGDYNRPTIRHPLAGALGWFGHFLNMPDDPLPGDTYTPRAQTPRTGPSERMAVSPGHEEIGILHMPGGQSGHPFSPHYADQHPAWASGAPLPFLPGPAVETLTLVP